LRILSALIIGAISQLGLAGVAMADPHDVFATFLTEEGTSHIRIVDCGDGTPCGTVSWIDPASLKDGMTPEDVISKKGEQVLGLQLLGGFDRKKKDWRGGTVYDPENDKMYSARLKRMDNGDLQLKGCIGPLCQTQVWTFVDDPQYAAHVSGNN